MVRRSSIAKNIPKNQASACFRSFQLETLLTSVSSCNFKSINVYSMPPRILSSILYGFSMSFSVRQMLTAQFMRKESTCNHLCEVKCIEESSPKGCDI